MEFSRRSMGKALFLSGAFGSLSCSRKGLKAGGYQNVEVAGGLAVLRLPENFAPLSGEQIRRRSRWIGVPNGPGVELKGDVVLDLIQMNFWGLSHAFGLGESVDKEGRSSVDALLVVSRLADAQAFAPAHAYVSSASEYSPDRRWKAAREVVWKREATAEGSTVDEKVSSQAAGKEKRYRISEGQLKDVGVSVVLEDRVKMMQAMLLASGPPKEHPRLLAAMKEILREASSSYILKQPLDDYFRQVSAAVEAMAAARRVRYLELLQTLQDEGLDYSPTPKVVRFNPNLVCRFFWPAYDRSGVPLEISFAARLGRLLHDPSAESRPTFQSGRMLVLKRAEERSQDSDKESRLARDAGWVDDGTAVAALSFSFSEEIPDFSLWLDEVEAASKQGLAQGFLELAN